MLIKGIETNAHPDIGQWYNLFIYWIKHPSVLTLSFEEFVISHSSCLATTKKIAQFVTEDQLSPDQLNQWALKMIENLHPQTSSTFRKGKIGGWRDEFTDEMKEAFKAAAGNLLISLGYEENFNW
ncbi:TPA: hypothetical protein VGS93_005389 [Bacillus cereus]|nr:hypothetical protein [Bacillus cereus]